ncbi:MAG: methyltransferase [Nanoarchaeota archaeon]
MKGIALCQKGFENIASDEINELIFKESIKNNGYLIFDIDNLNEIFKLCYLSRSLSKVMLLFNSFKFDNSNFQYNLIESNLPYNDLKEWLENNTFKVNTIKLLELDENSTKISSKIGEFIINKISTKVDLENPKYILTNIISKNNIYVGIDFSRFDLSKRDYKIYNFASSLNGSFAYCVLKSGGWTKDKSIIDPMCGSGVIAIEAALKYANKSPQFYRKNNFNLEFNFEKFDLKINKNYKDSKIYCYDYMLNCINTSKNNAKIADIDKYINFSKTELEWLETRFDENSIDYIVTNPSEASKHCNIKKIKKLYDELFYQSKFILKKNGTLTIVTRSNDLIIEFAKKHKFNMIENKEVYQGKQKYSLIILKK